jgi:hypothetical protein
MDKMGVENSYFWGVCGGRNPVFHLILALGGIETAPRNLILARHNANVLCRLIEL